MKKNLLKGVMAMALMAMSLPMQADGVKWLEKCLDAEHLKMEAKNATTLSFNAGDKSITVSGENLAAQEYKMTLTPDAAIQLTNAQTYIVIEASVNVDGSKKLNKITANGIDYENNATARALMPVNPLNAILVIENPDGVDSVSSVRIEDNAVTFYLDSTHTQYVGVSRMQLRLFDQDGCAITLPHFTFEIRENIYGSGDVRFQNVVMVDQTGTVLNQAITLRSIN